MKLSNQQPQIPLFRHGEDGFTNELCLRLSTRDLNLSDLLPGNTLRKNECIESIYIRPTSGNRCGFGEPDAVIVTNHRLIFVESKFYFSNQIQKFDSKKIDLNIPAWVYQLDRHMSHLDTISQGKTSGPVKLTLACLEANSKYSDEEKEKLIKTLAAKKIFHKGKKNCHKNWLADEIYEDNNIKQEYITRAENGFVLFVNLSDRNIDGMKETAVKSILEDIEDDRKVGIKAQIDSMFSDKVKLILKIHMDQTQSQWEWTKRWFD